VQDDGKPDPRFEANAEQLKKQGVTDYQLHYALQTISRLGKVQQAAAPAAAAPVAAPKKTGTR
jgi:carboxyl-terminal processing protease